MSVHQIIHTCRKCGLYGGGAGFGILSADRNFPENNSFGEALYEITGAGKDALMGR